MRGPDRDTDRERRRPNRWFAGAAVLLVFGLGFILAGSGPVAAQTAELSVTPNPAHPGEPVRLDGRNSTGGGATIAGCEFDVDGDGQYERQSDTCVVDHTYRRTGEYEVRLRVTTDTNEVDSDAVALSVRDNEPPVAAIAVDPGAPRPGETVTLSGTDSTDGDGTVVAYTWTLPDGNTSGEAVNTSFAQVGEYNVTLTVTDDDGASGTTRSTVEINQNQPPIAALSVSPETVTAGGRVLLDAGGSTDPEGAIVGYRWDLDGDGTIDARTEIDRIAYEPGGPGEYEPAVTVVDDRGASDTDSASYAVRGGRTPTPVPAIDPTPATPTPAGAGGVRVSPLVLGSVLLVVLVLLAGLGVGVRRRDLADEAVETLRELITRGDVRQRLARVLSRTIVKNAAKRAIRRFADVIDAAGDAIGEAIERVGRAIKRASDRVAAWLRRLGS